jgi:uncharacterized protein with HEPN domain
VEFRESSAPPIPRSRWSDIVGMRHGVVLDYLHINLDVVWDTADGILRNS